MKRIRGEQTVALDRRVLKRVELPIRRELEHPLEVADVVVGAAVCTSAGGRVINELEGRVELRGIVVPVPRVVCPSEGGADAGHLGDGLSFCGEESLVQKLERAREIARVEERQDVQTAGVVVTADDQPVGLP